MWWYVAALVASIVLGYVLQPKPSSSGQKSATLSDFDVATAEEGRVIPVLFGTRIIKSPNVVWYGDFRSKAVKKKGGKK